MMSSVSLHSYERVTKLPVVECTMLAASDIYGRMKGSNVLTKVVLESAEHTARKAVLLVQPVTIPLKAPIEIADSVLCKTLDIIETTLPCIKSPPQELYASTIGSIPVQPAVEFVTAAGNLGIQKLNELFQKMQKSSENSEDIEEQEQQVHQG